MKNLRLDLGQGLQKFARNKFEILIVDDVRDNLLALNALLERTDVNISQALSGEEALELMLKHDFCLALIDVQMPGMSGFELAELMRGAKKTRDIPIIFVTATAKEQSFSFKGYESGAVDFLLKPLDSHAVKSKVNIFIELYRREQDLKSAESKFRGLLETAPDAIVIINESGKIELANKQAENVFGYDRSELIGQPMEMLMPDRFRSNHVSLRTSYAAQPGARPMGRGLKLFGLRKDGSEFSIDISLSPLTTEQGTLISASIRDISERRALEKEQDELLLKLKKTQSELEQAIQIRDEFMSIASHELKTPLTTLKLQSQLRKRSLKDGRLSDFTPEKLNLMFNSDGKQLERIDHLIDDMLDISRISTGKLSMNLEVFDLCALVRDVVARSSELFIAAACPITVKLCQPALGNWDSFRIEQVLMNLLTNAMRYGAGNAILVGVETSAKRVQIIVCNKGRGIAKENHERIFQRFERAVSNHEIGGLGLGLYIVRQIVEGHEGSIKVESELGKGATFTVELPLLEQAEEVSPAL